MEPVTPKPDIAPTRPNDMLPSDVHTITPLPYYISSGDQVGFVPAITHACGPAYVHAHFVCVWLGSDSINSMGAVFLFRL